MNDRAASMPNIARDRGPTAEGSIRVLLVTGMSGAGKTSALKSLEDMGYEAVDNIPLSLLGSLVMTGPHDSAAARSPIAIGVDVRTRDFGAQAFMQELDQLAGDHGVRVRVLFLDCDDDALRRRYAETRHRHPLAQDRPVSDGIATERRMVSALRDRADVVLDTSGLALGDLKRTLEGHFGIDSAPGLAVFVTSFSFRHGLPREADLVFDVRFLANPHYVADLRPLDGRDVRVADYIAADPDYDNFFDRLTGLLMPLLPRYAAEGKSYLTIAVGCTGGRHRSVFVAERLAAWLEAQGQRVHSRHRDMEKGN